MTLRAVPVLVALSVAVSVCAQASAQTTTAAQLQGTPVRRDGREPQGIKPTVINYADCSVAENITFKLNILSSSLSLDVWAGTVADCGNPMHVSTLEPEQCWRVATKTPWPMDQFQIPVREILPHHASGVDTAPDTVCDDLAKTGTGNGSVTLYFIPLSGNQQSGGTNATYAMTYDLQGPVPPTDFNVGLGDSRLIPTWTAGSRADINSYRLYCQPSADCSSTYLIPGAIPGSEQPDDVKTSTAGPNSTQGEVTGLENDQNYICGIAAMDPNGNLGNLSDTDCGAPKPVNGYYKSYRAAGGQAGGGYCSFGRAVNPAAPPLVLVAIAALAARRKRNGKTDRTERRGSAV